MGINKISGIVPPSRRFKPINTQNKNQMNSFHKTIAKRIPPHYGQRQNEIDTKETNIAKHVTRELLNGNYSDKSRGIKSVLITYASPQGPERAIVPPIPKGQFTDRFH